MTTTINASPTNGFVATADGSGVMKLQSNGKTTNAIAWGNYQYVASGSVPVLGASYNITSITRNSTGSYTFAFTTAQTDANYAVVGCMLYPAGPQSALINATTKTTTSVTIIVGYTSSIGGALTLFDYGLDFAIFGN